jgi:hypothetical protein
MNCLLQYTHITSGPTGSYQFLSTDINLIYVVGTGQLCSVVRTGSDYMLPILVYIYVICNCKFMISSGFFNPRKRRKTSFAGTMIALIKKKKYDNHTCYPRGCEHD